MLLRSVELDKFLLVMGKRMNKRLIVTLLVITTFTVGCSTTRGISKADPSKSESSFTTKNVPSGIDELISTIAASIFFAVALSTAE